MPPHDRVRLQHMVDALKAAGRFVAGPSVRSGRHQPINELARVALSVPVETGAGTLPAGAVGTVVGVYRQGAAYEVEFTIPFHAVATVTPDAIGR